MFLIPFRNQRTIGLGCSHYSRCFNVSMLLDTKHTSICIFHPHNYHLVPSYLMFMSFFSAWPHHSISDPITLAYILRRHSLISFFFSFVFSFHSCFISLSSIHPLIMSIHVHSFIHSITSSFVCPFIRSSFLSFIRSFIRLISFICSFVHSFDSFIRASARKYMKPNEAQGTYLLLDETLHSTSKEVISPFKREHKSDIFYSQSTRKEHIRNTPNSLWTLHCNEY